MAFRSFGEHCGATDVAIMTNPFSENAQHPMVTSAINMDVASDQHKVYIHRPNLKYVTPLICFPLRLGVNFIGMLKHNNLLKLKKT